MGSALERLPKRFLAWALVKTVTQVVIAYLSIMFIAQSNFFVPYAYDATVWSKRAIQILYLPQGIFEICDLIAELWMLKRQNSKAHLPWDSIAHHTVSAAYAFYIYLYAFELDHSFLGLAVAALSCQVIGPLYTLHRLKLRWRFLPLMILGVQSLYRCPLAIVSLIRAAQFYAVCPWPHLVICVVLAQLDYRWTFWAYKMHRRAQQRHKEAMLKKNDSESCSSKDAENTSSMAVPSLPLATQHLKAL